nr:ATPase [Lachnospiraceae bacterium]
EQGSPKVEKALDGKEAFLVLKELLEESRAANKAEASSVKANFEAVFSFLEEVFGDGQEMLILVTELTTNPYTANFIGKYGCEAYFKHNKDLLFSERQKEIMNALKDLSLS